MPELNLVGRTLGRYEILAPLGAGGMAVVYRARQTDLERVVALKILPPELSLDKSYIARFHQEARSAAALEHPHIVPIYDVGSAEGLHYIAMKYVAGRTLRDLIQERGPLPIAEAAGLLDQVAAALDYAHSQGIIHRDIKPSNMMVERSGWVYLTDFGLARGGASGGLTQTGTVMGTPEYMSPEQAQGLPTIGTPTDIYALGVVLYELLTGKMPFQAETPMGMLVARLQYAPTPPREHRGDLPLAVEDVVMRALARRPDARPPSATELVADLKRAAGIGSGALPSPARPLSPPYGTPAPTAAGMRTAAPAGPRPPSLPHQAPSAPQALAPRYPTPPPPPTSSGQPTLASFPPSPAAPHPPAAGGRAASRRPLLIVGVALAIVLLTVVLGVVGRQRSDAEVQAALRAGQVATGEAGGLDRAIDAYRRAIALDEDSPNAHASLALIYLLRGDYDAAQDAADDAVAADREYALGHAMLAEALAAQGAYEDAIRAADEGVRLGQRLPQTFAARAVVKADRATDINDADLLAEAVEDAERAVELASGKGALAEALAHNARGFVYWQQYILDGDSATAEESAEQFGEAIRLQRQIALFHTNLGYVYNEQGANALIEGDEAVAQRRLDQARRAFEDAQAADPSYSGSHAGLGWNLYYLKDYAGARGEFDKAIELSPRSFDAYIGKARALLDQPEPDVPAAIEVLEVATERVRHEPALFAALGWARITLAFGQEAERAGETYAQAEEAFRAAVDLNERSVDGLTGLGWALAGQDRYDEALETLNRALALSEEADAHFGIGWAYYRQSKYPEAEAAFRRAVELRPRDGGNHYWLGLALREQGRTEEARQALQRAVELGNPFAQAALDELK